MLYVLYNGGGGGVASSSHTSHYLTPPVSQAFFSKPFYPCSVFPFYKESIRKKSDLNNVFFRFLSSCCFMVGLTLKAVVVRKAVGKSLSFQVCIRLNGCLLSFLFLLRCIM